MKTRFSITMSKDVLRNLDATVDGVAIRSRSEAIETIINRYLESNKVAVFLGGGDPERLRLGSTFRPFVKIDGKPLISYSIDNLRNAGFRKIYFIAQKEVVSEAFRVLGNGADLGVDINYVEEKRALGEFKTLQLVEKEMKTPFLILQIDNYFTFDINNLFKAFHLNKSLMTVAIHAREDVSNRKGIVEMSGSSIVAFEEERKMSRSTLASTTMAMCDPGIFRYIPQGNTRFTKNELFPLLINEKQLSGFIIQGPWFNIHTKGDANKLSDFLKETSVTE